MLSVPLWYSIYHKCVTPVIWREVFVYRSSGCETDKRIALPDDTRARKVIGSNIAVLSQ